MKKPTLLILAAGMGSRYGGIKQLDFLGPHGETIMDYSINDAIEAGFGKVVFVIRKSMYEDFSKQILSKYKDKISVQVAYQELDMLPEGYSQNSERQKPYGTAHAILVAQNVIDTPFAVINADDFYGKEAFMTMSKFLMTPQKEEKPTFAMVGYKLENTLSENGSVSRGVCVANQDDELTHITEMTKISRDNGIIRNFSTPEAILTGKESVSMNFWGFTPYFFQCLNDCFIDFLKHNNDNPKSEFPIPSVIEHFIDNKMAVIKILRCDASWFGVTYQEDKPYVMKQLAALNQNL